MSTHYNRAIQVVLQTTPYLVFRAAVYALLCAAGLLYLGLLAVVGGVFGAGAFWALLIATVALGVMLGAGRMVNEILDHLVRTGHVALMAESVKKGRIPVGAQQIRWARERVAGRFRRVNNLSEVGRIVRRTVRDLNRTCFDMESTLPFQGVDGTGKLADRVVNLSYGYLNNGVMGLLTLSPAARMYTTLKTAVVYYCQSWKTLMVQAVNLTLLSYAFMFAATFAFMAPLGLIAILTDASASAGFVLFLMAIGFAVAAKNVVYDPVADAMMVMMFLEQAEVHEPDPEWEAKAESVSKRFATLAEKAAAEDAASPEA